MILADLTWVQAGELAGDTATDPEGIRRRPVLAVPLGATEQHGPHLPLSVDTDVATELCRRLEIARAHVLVAPTLPYGASGEHAGFPGTLSIGHEALEHLLVELGRSAAATCPRILFVCAHGGNAAPLARAVRRLRDEGRDVRSYGASWPGDPHAGRQETSMALAIDPRRVRMGRARPGDTRPLRELWPALRAGGVRAVSPSGVLGDPTHASAGEGKDLLGRLTEELVRTVDEWPAT